MKKLKKSKLLPYIALNFMIFLLSIGGICSKLAASKEYLSVEWIILYGIMLLLLAIYAVSWQQILKKIPLNTAYTLKSIGVIWTLIWGVLIFREHLSILHLVSVLFIIAGAVLVTTSGKTKKEDKNNE